jgi:tetratricopeptide (TPR) repeat protein
MSRRTALVIAALIGVVAAGYVGWRWTRGGSGHAEPPLISAELTDPASRKLIESKRQQVLASPESSAAWGELGMAFDAHNETKSAADCYRRAMALDADDPRWPYLLAGKLGRGGGSETEEAVRLYRQAVNCPSPSSAHRNVATLTLADLLTELGRGAEATPLYEQAYARDSNDPWAAYRMAMTLSDRGETEKAGAIFVNLIRNPFTRKKSAIALAELSRRAGKTKDADEFDTAAGLVPPDAAWMNPFTAPLNDLRRGRRALMDRYVREEASQADRAAVRTATALADQYPSVETQMVLLRALVNADDYPAALAVADDLMRDAEGRKLVTAHSFLGLARLGMAERAEAEGRKDDADKLLTQAAEALGESVRLKPDYAPGHIFRSKVLLRLGKLTEAEASARAGVECRPEEWEGYLALAEAQSAAGHKPEAIKTLEQAVKLAPPNEPRPKQALDALKK